MIFSMTPLNLEYFMYMRRILTEDKFILCYFESSFIRTRPKTYAKIFMHLFLVICNSMCQFCRCRFTFVEYLFVKKLKM